MVTLISFGEAAQAFASAGGWHGNARAYDKLTNDARTRSAKEGEYRAAQVKGCESNAAAATGAALILSLVTADQTLAAAIEAARHVQAGALFCDMNSVVPATKQAAAAAIEAQGGRYVDVAVTSPVNPGRLAVPLLLSGAEAAAAERVLRQLGFSNQLCRSINRAPIRAAAASLLGGQNS